MATSETIIATQTHPGDSSDQTITSEKFKGDGYYGRADGFHTVQVALTGFLGKVEIQASLAINPADEDWFTVNITDVTTNTTSNYVEYLINETSSKMYNFTGNFVWVRCLITSWTDGSVNSIKLNH